MQKKNAKKEKKEKKTPAREASPAARGLRKGLRIFGRAFNFVGDGLREALAPKLEDM